MAKNLVFFYSRTGENYWNGSIRNIPKGNTEIVAEFIQKAVGADLFQVETVKPYAAAAAVRWSATPAPLKPVPAISIIRVSAGNGTAASIT